MKTNDILNTTIGNKTQIGKISEVLIKETEDRYKNILPKLFITVETSTNTFIIDEAWLLDKANTQVCKGLWVKLDAHQKLNSMSTIAKLLVFFNKKSINDLIGQEVEIYPKHNGYLAIIAYENQE